MEELTNIVFKQQPILIPRKKKNSKTSSKVPNLL
nr:hypothetical protein [Leptospira interrogans]